MTIKYNRILKLPVIITLILAVFVFFPVPEAVAIDEQITDRYPSATASPKQKIKEAGEEYVYEPETRTSFTGYVDMQGGYDNNVDLDSQRNKDGFIQTTANVDIAYEQTENLKLRTGLDLFNSTYFNYNRNNLLDTSPYIGFDYKFAPNIISKNRIIFDYYWFPTEEEDTFYGPALSTSLRHYFANNFFQEAGFEYLWRWYTKQKVVLSNLSTGSDKRYDSRYRVQYTVGYYSNRFIAKLRNEFSQNNSNYEYENYYDYWRWRVKPSVMFFFTDKFYTDVSLIYRYTDYSDRLATDNASEKVHNNTYIINASFYYDITKDITWGITYSYSENLSNDPYEKYSGSVVTSGIYYSF